MLRAQHVYSRSRRLTWGSRGWQIFFTLGFIEVTTNASGLTPGTMFNGGRAPGPHPFTPPPPPLAFVPRFRT